MQTAQRTDRNVALLEWYPMVERLAHKAAATYGLPASVDTADLVSSGVLGLSHAWERYDPDRGVAFEAYAIPRVRGAIIDTIRAGDWIPRKARERSRLTGEPLSVLVSMDEHRGGEQGDRTTADTIADESIALPGAELLSAERRRELMAAMNRLPEREQMIVSLYYFEGVQLQTIAKQLGVTESRVSQLHGRALRMLREALEAFDSTEAATAA